MVLQRNGFGERGVEGGAAGPPEVEADEAGNYATDRPHDGRAKSMARALTNVLAKGVAVLAQVRGEVASFSGTKADGRKYGAGWQLT